MAVDSKQDIQSVYIPFVGNTSPRNSPASTKDQYFQNAIFDIVENENTGKKTYAARTRPATVDWPAADSGSVGGTIGYWKGDVQAFPSTGAGLFVAHTGGIYKDGTAIVSGTLGASGFSPFVDSLDSATNKYFCTANEEGFFVIDISANVTFLSSTTISTVSATNPAVVTTTSAHKLITGMYVCLRDITGMTPDVNGTQYQVTVLSPTTFSIPVNCTVAGANGNMGFPIAPSLALSTIKLAVMNGYVYALADDGRIFNSEFNDPLHWISTRYLTAQMYPGTWTALATQNNFLVAFSTLGLQTFVDVANPSPASPLENYESGAQKIGTWRPLSVVNDGQRLTWIGITAAGEMTVYTMDGLGAAVDIGTGPIRRLLNNFSYFGATAARLQGRLLYIVYTNSASYPWLVYDYEAQIWSYWKLASSKVAYGMSAAGGSALYISTSTGDGLYTDSSQTTPADSGVAFEFVVQTDRIDFGTQKRKFPRRLELVADKATATSNATVSYSDDDYVTFSTAQTLNTNLDRPFIPHAKNFRRRSYKFTYSGTIQQRWFGFELYFRFGTD